MFLLQGEGHPIDVAPFFKPVLHLLIKFVSHQTRRGFGLKISALHITLLVKAAFCGIIWQKSMQSLFLKLWLPLLNYSWRALQSIFNPKDWVKTYLPMCKTEKDIHCYCKTSSKVVPSNDMVFVQETKLFPIKSWDSLLLYFCNSSWFIRIWIN